MIESTSIFQSEYGSRPFNCERIKEVFNYQKDTGIFTRKIKAGGNPVGSVAGWVNKFGYVSMDVDGNRLQAHRIAWLYMYGDWPNGDIDHIDGNPSNNSISNLRCVTKSINLQNQRRAKKNNSSGYLGVSWDKSREKWFSCIEVNGKTKALGRYSTPIEAYEKYVSAKRELHEGNTL